MLSKFEISIAVASVILGVVIIVAEIKELAFAVASKRWKMIEGRIIESRTLKIPDTSVDYLYTPHVRYSYEINGHGYFGERRRFGSYNKKVLLSFGRDIGSSFPWFAKRLLKNYELGKTVSIFISPKDPHLSVLEPGVHYDIVFPMFMGIIFIIGGLSALILGI